MRSTWNRLLRAVSGRRLPVWYHPDYRLPLGGLEGKLGLEPRRADHVAWYLLEVGAISAGDLQVPPRISHGDMARVHTAAWLQSLTTPEGFGAVFGVRPEEVRVDEGMNLVRLATGGTLAAAREALRSGGPTLNLQGGFHHAFPDRGGGLCAVNDLAIALAALRHDGFDGQVVVLDLDAHPPDGTAACLRLDPRAWVGSLSGSDWGPVPGADETVLPAGTGDDAYLGALEALLQRMPPPALAFVIAGGDVLAGDRFGCLALSLAGARRRELVVADALRAVPSVWLPGGGYSEQSWKVLAGVGLALALRSAEPIPDDLDPLDERFREVAARLQPSDLGDDPLLNDEDLAEVFGFRPQSRRLLGYYTAEGLELGLFEYGILEQLTRLGYVQFRVDLDRAAVGERFRLYGTARDPADPAEHLLVEAVLDRERLPDGGDAPWLYVHWLTLRDPRAHFTPDRPALPGQEVPGLGLAREATALLLRMSERLGLAGLALRPAWVHVAYASRSRFRFLDAGRQGRWEALIRDLGHLPLRALSEAVAQGRVSCDGAPYAWEADPMVASLAPLPDDAVAVAAARQRARFALHG